MSALFLPFAAPLASLDAVVRLGNTGDGSDLGHLFAFIAPYIAPSDASTVPELASATDSDFSRLLVHASSGCIKRSAFGKFIAQNIPGDRAQHAGDLVTLAGQVVHTLHKRANGYGDPNDERRVIAKLTKLLSDDPLLARASELGLLAAFVAHSPRTQHVRSVHGTEPAYATVDLAAILREQRVPEGYETWRKAALDWALSAGAIAVAAERAVIRAD
jgi:hypothetical protein